MTDITALEQQFETDVGLVHQIVHGTASATVLVGAGVLPTFAKQLADNQASINTAIAQATPGSVWRSGAGAPSNTLGVNSDFYLNNTSWDVYQKASGLYSVVTNIKGAAATNGINGTNGSIWRSGAGVPSNALGVDGDFFLNTNTSDIYKRTAGVYAVILNIQGPTGPAGSVAEVTTYTTMRAYAGTADVLFMVSARTGGMFRYDASDASSSDNGGTIIVASNGKRWKRMFDGPVNPMWFGAMGDGTTDDSAAFQAAVDYCSTLGGGEVKPGAGNFVVLEVNLKSNITMNLSGATVTKGTTASATSYVFRMTGTMSATTSALSSNAARNATSVVVTSAAGFAVGDIVMLYDLTYAYSTFGRNQEMNRIIGISGTTITLANQTLGSYATASTATLTKVSAAAENIHVVGGKIKNPTGNSGGIIDIRRAYDCSVRDSELVGFYDKPAVDINESAYTLVSRNIMRDGQGATPGGTNSWPLACGDSAHHVNIKDNRLANYNQVTFTNGSRYITFVDNHCTGFQDSAVNTHGAGSNNVTIARNICTGGAQYGITIGQSTSNAAEKNILVDANIISNIAATAINVDASVGKEQVNIVVSNNILSNFGLTIASQPGIFIGHTTDATLSGNHVDGGTSTNVNYGIWLLTAVDLQVTGNHVLNIPNGYGYGIQSCTRAHLVANYAKAIGSFPFRGLTNTNCRLVANMADVTGSSLDAGCTSVSNSI